jgi:SSS family solute:Na+ symporter
VSDTAVGVAFVVVLSATSLLALLVRRDPHEGVPGLQSWALADRRYGSLTTWMLLGGSIFTAYTFVAVPGLVHGIGALGLFALPYTIIVCPLAFVVLPALHRVAAEHGYITVSDLVRGRWGSPALATAVALTGLLATMPYVTLQLIGVRAVLQAGGLYPSGLQGDLALTAVFAVLACSTWRTGLRAPALIALVKAVLVFSAVAALVLAALDRLGGPGGVFDLGAAPVPLTLGPGDQAAYATLAVGSALALLLYPHVLTAAFSSRSEHTLRRAVVALPAWTALLGLFGILGLAAIAAGVQVAPGRAETAVPLLVADLLPAVLTGVVFAALAIGALVPAAVMSVAAGALVARNVHAEWFASGSTPKMQTRVARFTSLAVKAGALLFLFLLREQAAINLQLLGGVWILQTLPAVVVGMWWRWPHRTAVLAGWATGMAVGTLLVATGGFSSLVHIAGVPVYAALVALGVNVAVAAALTPLLDLGAVPRGVDETAVPRPRRAPALSPGAAS